MLANPDEAAASDRVTQSGWRFCQRCRVLFFSPKGRPAGRCPSGGKHRPLKGLMYGMILWPEGGLSAGMKGPYAKCEKCLGIFSQAFQPISVCPAGGQHKLSGHTDFQIWAGSAIPIVMDPAWSGCAKCEGIFNWAGAEVGVCPAGEGHQEYDGTLTLMIL